MVPGHHPREACLTTLIVVSHPDDEVLGAGGYAALSATRGVEVRACILSGTVEARQQRPGTADLLADTERAQALLGLQAPVMGAFPNIKFNTVPHLDLVQFIERVVREHRVTEILTHHPADLNDDHRHTSHAAQVASRLCLRDRSLPPLRRLAFMEILSSTDWAFPQAGAAFQPNAFVELGASGLERKLQALAAYRDVMRPYPHSRSREAVAALATLRGAQAGLDLAEAFQVVFERLAPGAP